MRIVFAGTPEFAAAALRALLAAAPQSGWTIPLVLSQPDRPSGRGMKLAASPVRQLAQSHGIAVATPRSLRKGDDAPAALAQLAAARPDVLVVAAYGLILPQAVLDLPRAVGAGITAINIHASLLPRWRGAAPVVRALEAGDAVTGITIMQMDAGLDTGPMLLAQPLPIAADDTGGTLTDRLARLGGEQIVTALRQVDALRPLAQPAEGVTYAHKLDKREAWLDWTAGAEVLARRVRAFDPFPVACTQAGQQILRVWRAQPRPHVAAAPGTVLQATGDALAVATGDGVLTVTELQRAGGKRLSAREFLAGHPLAVGTLLQTAVA